MLGFKYMPFKHTTFHHYVQAGRTVSIGPPPSPSDHSHKHILSLAHTRAHTRTHTHTHTRTHTHTHTRSRSRSRVCVRVVALCFASRGFTEVCACFCFVSTGGVKDIDQTSYSPRRQNDTWFLGVNARGFLGVNARGFWVLMHVVFVLMHVVWVDARGRGHGQCVS